MSKDKSDFEVCRLFVGAVNMLFLLLLVLGDSLTNRPFMAKLHLLLLLMRLWHKTMWPAFRMLYKWMVDAQQQLQLQLQLPIRQLHNFYNQTDSCVLSSLYLCSSLTYIHVSPSHLRIGQLVRASKLEIKLILRKLLNSMWRLLFYLLTKLLLFFSSAPI